MNSLMDLVGRWRGRDHVLDVVQPHLDRVSNALGADAAFIHFDALLCIAIDHHVRACVGTISSGLVDWIERECAYPTAASWSANRFQYT